MLVNTYTAKPSKLSFLDLVAEVCNVIYEPAMLDVKQDKAQSPIKGSINNLVQNNSSVRIPGIS